MTNEIVTNHCKLELINESCNSLIKNKHEKRAMDLKNQVCKLNEKWDQLYQQSKLKEKSAQKILSVWFIYKEKLKMMHDYFNDINERMKMKKCSNSDELLERIHAYQVWCYVNILNKL